MEKELKKIAIVLHIYYTDLWEHYKNKLLSLNTEFDLYITLCDEVEDITKDILKSFPTASVKKYRNKGLDIGPFLLTVKDLGCKKYDYLIKLHTKGFGSVDYAKNPEKKKCNVKEWRRDLVNTLISSDDQIKQNISILESGEYKMIGCKKWHMKQKWSLKDEKTKKKYEFIGGTMFMVDFKFFKQLWTKETIKKYYQKMPKNYDLDRTFTHYTERQLGQRIIDAGFKIKGV